MRHMLQEPGALWSVVSQRRQRIDLRGAACGHGMPIQLLGRLIYYQAAVEFVINNVPNVAMWPRQEV